MTPEQSRELFRRDMIRWLYTQSPNGDFSDSEAAAQGGRPITIEDGIAHATDWAKGDIGVDMRAGRVPITVRSFAHLHDYVDANGLGGAFDWPCLPSEDRDDAYQLEFARFWNEVARQVDDWITSGQMRNELGRGRCP